MASEQESPAEQEDDGDERRRLLTPPVDVTRTSIDTDDKGRPSAIESLATTLARAAAQIDRLCREIHPPAELLEARRAVEVSALCLRNLIDSGELDKPRPQAPRLDT
jgi:hypothetical protein